jgi:hypothetical protein
VQQQRSILLKGRLAIYVSRSSEICPNGKLIQVKPFKLTKGSMICGVMNLGRHKVFNIVGFCSRITEATPASSHDDLFEKPAIFK